jgi:hypothetical protein
MAALPPFIITNKLYTEKSSAWINELENNEVQPFVINKFLMMNDKVLPEVKYLNQFTFCLEPKQFLHLAWCVLPKYDKAPFCKYIKKQDVLVEHEEILEKVHTFLEIQGSDCVSDVYFVKEMSKDWTKWLRLFGMDKKVWKKYGLDYKEMKKGIEREVVKQKKGLDAWF